MVVRQIESRDAAQAAQVWCDGLQQTVDAAPPEKRDAYLQHFQKSVEEEQKEGGMVGIHGQGLIDFYLNNDDRCMFVAVREDDGTVLGLVGIKRGMDYKQDPADTTDEDYKWCSIWKMSVREDARGQGVACRLMQACEVWAKERSMDAIRLYTANPIAASFYTNKAGFVEIKKTDHVGIYEKKVQ